MEPESAAEKAKRQADEKVARDRAAKAAAEKSAAEAKEREAELARLAAAAKSKATTLRKAESVADSKAAAGLLDLAKQFIDAKMPEKAEPRLRKIIEKYPASDAAKEARQILKIEEPDGTSAAPKKTDEQLLEEAEKRKSEADASAAAAARENAANDLLTEAKKMSKNSSWIKNQLAVWPKLIEIATKYPETKAGKEAEQTMNKLNPHWKERQRAIEQKKQPNSNQ
jgi:colicin import membrane protein